MSRNYIIVKIECFRSCQFDIYVSYSSFEQKYVKYFTLFEYTCENWIIYCADKF